MRTLTLAGRAALRLASVYALPMTLSVASAAAQARGSESGDEPGTESAPCASTSFTEVPGGIVIRAATPACLHQIGPQLRTFIIVATASPAAATARGDGSRSNLPISPSTAKLRTLAVMRDQWQPPPTTALSSVGIR